MSLSGSLRQRSRKHRDACAERRSYHCCHHHDIHKISKLTQVRMQCFEIKIQFRDFCERVANSITESLSHATGTRKVKRNVPRRSKVKSTNFRTSRGRQPYSDLEPMNRHRSQRSISKNRSESAERFEYYRRGYHDDRHITNSGRRYLRKQRSSLTSKKNFTGDGDEMRDSFRKASKKSLEIGDNTTSCESRKLFCGSSGKRRSRTCTKAREKVSRKQVKFYKSEESSVESGASTNQSGDEDVEDKQPKSKVDPTESDSKNETKPNPEEASKELETKPTEVCQPPILRNPDMTAFCYKGALNDAQDSKGFFLRFFDYMSKPRKRKYDPTTSRPKIVKFGFQVNTASQAEARKRDPVNKFLGLVGLNQTDSPDTPPTPTPSLQNANQTLASQSNYNAFMPSTTLPPAVLGTSSINLFKPLTTTAINIPKQYSPEDSLQTRFRRLLLQRQTQNFIPASPATTTTGVPTPSTLDKKPPVMPSHQLQYNLDSLKAILLPNLGEVFSIQPSTPITPPASSNASSNNTPPEANNNANPTRSDASVLINNSLLNAKTNYSPKTAFTTRYTHLLPSN